MFKIALNAGHGLYTAGKECWEELDPKKTKEWTLNNRICDKIESKLKEYTGYSLLRLDDTTGAVDVPLKTRTNKANAFKADFYLSVHHNAGIKGGNGGGVIAIVYKKVDNVTLEWQEELYNAIIKKTGLRGNRANPLQKQNLHECRESAMPCVLLECGFMDSVTDVPIILSEDFAEKVASACVEVLVKKGKLTKKTTTIKAEVEVVKQEDNKYFKKYTGNTVSIVAALNAIGVTSTYAYRGKIAKKNGIKMYVGTASQNTTMLNLLKNGKLLKP